MSENKLTGFELLQKVGQGGMGVVWKARQLSLDRVVAIKVLREALSHDPEEVKRIMNEARTAARLKHPGIVQVYDASEEAGSYYFVMEYVDGYNVGQWIQRKQRIPWKDALLVAEYVAVALDYAWQSAGMIHCDIKPENIMVDQDGTIKVSDLGLSVTRERLGEQQTEILGTPSYMSPEQVQGEAQLDCRTDIYSLGASLYHMIAGRRMFQDVPDRDAMDCQVTGQVPDVRELVPTLPASVASLLERMLVKNRDLRLKDWTTTVAELRRVQRGLMPAGKPPPAGSSTMKRVRVKLGRGKSEDGEKPAKPGWGGWLVVGLVVAAILAVVLLPKSNRAWLQSLVRPATSGGLQGVPSTGTEPDADGSAAGEYTAGSALAEAEQWMQKNPDRFEACMIRFRRVTTDFPGTPEAETARQQLKNLRVRRDQAVVEAWRKLKDDAERLAADGQYMEASRQLESYAGQWAEATSSNRLDLARALRQKSVQQQGARVNEGNWKEWVRSLADPLVQGKFAVVQKAVTDVQADGQFATHKADIETLARIMQGLGTLDERVIQSFLKQTGSVVRVGLGRGEISVRVEGVTGNKVRGRTLDGQAEVLIGYDELSGSERLARLGAIDAPEIAIAKGVSALNAGAYDEAEACFGKAGPLLSGLLIEKLGDARSGTAGVQAEAALGQILKLAGATVGAYDEAAWLAAVNGCRLDAARGAQVLAEVDKFLEKYGRSGFAVKASPVILLVQQLCQRAIEGKTAAVEAPAPAVPEVAVKVEPAAAPAPAPAEPIVPATVNDAMVARNPGLEPEAFAWTAVDGVPNTGLEIASDSVHDLSPLVEAKGIRRLHVKVRTEGTKSAIDLKPLAGTCVTDLRLEGYTVKDLSVVRGLKVTRLAIPGSPIVSLMPLEGLPLVALDVSGTDVRDLTALRAMRLESLNIAKTKVASLSLLVGMPLRELNAGGTLVRDLYSIKGMPLESVSLEQSQAYDFLTLKGLNLTHLDLNGTKVHDVSFCGAMPLKTLLLRETPVQDLAALKGKTMDLLDLTGSQVKDLAGLAGCTIKELSLANTKLTARELAALEQVNVERLNLAGTGVTSLGFLKGKALTWLDIESTKVKDLTPLRGMPLRYLNCQGADVVDFNPLRGMPIEELNTSGDLRELRDIARTLPNLRSVNGFDVRERPGLRPRPGPPRGND